jgi:hypothetical protein
MPIKIDDTYDVNATNTLHTSGYDNTCALAAGSNLIANQLLSLTDEQAVDSPLFAWAETFARFYQIEKSLDLSYFKTLFRNYPNPRDQQLILAPVLRMYLSELIKNDSEIQINLFDASGDISKISFKRALKSFLLKNGRYSSIYRSNQNVFNNVLAQYETHGNGASRNDETRFEAFFTAHEDELYDLWHNVCAAQYADYIGSNKRQHYLEADEAAIVYNKLGISLNAYQPLERKNIARGYFVLNFPAKDALATLDMSIKDVHWETCEDVEAVVTMHNATFFSQSVLKQDPLIIKNAVLAEVSLNDDIDSDVESEVDAVDHTATTSEDESDDVDTTALVVSVEARAKALAKRTDATATEVKDSLLNIFQQAYAESHAAGLDANAVIPLGADLVRYSFRNDKHGITHFVTNKFNQRALDTALAALLSKDENEFNNLPSFK